MTRHQVESVFKISTMWVSSKEQIVLTRKSLLMPSVSLVNLESNVYPLISEIVSVNSFVKAGSVA